MNAVHTLNFITLLTFFTVLATKIFRIGTFPTLSFKIIYDSIPPKTMNTIFLSRYFIINCMTRFCFKKEMFEKYEILNIAIFPNKGVQEISKKQKLKKSLYKEPKS